MTFDSWGPTAIDPPSFSQHNPLCNKSCGTHVAVCCGTHVAVCCSTHVAVCCSTHVAVNIIRYATRVASHIEPPVHINPVIFWPLNPSCQYRTILLSVQPCGRLGEAIANRKLFWFHKPKMKSIFVAHLIVQIFAVSWWSCRRGWSSAVVLHLCRLQWWLSHDSVDATIVSWLIHIYEMSHMTHDEWVMDQ